MKFIILFAVLQVVWGNPAVCLKGKRQEKTLATLEKLADGQLYKLDYKADYKLQDVLDAGLNSQAAVREFAAAHLLDIPAAPPSGPENPACSAFQAVTPEGDIIYGRNFDYDFPDGASIMMRTRPRKGFKSLSMVTMNFVGLSAKQLGDGKTDLSMLMAAPLMQMDGMNEKGLAVSVLAITYDDCAKQFDPEKKDIMTSVMMRMLLDKASTVDEALSMLDKYNFWSDGWQKERKKGNFSNYHFLLSDAGGKTVLLEYVKENGPGSDSRWIMNPLDESFATNHFRSQGWDKLKKADDRYLHLKEVLAGNKGIMTEQEAMKLLDEVHQSVKKNNNKTQWSVVYNLTKGTAKVCINHQYDQTYEFSLKKFK